MNDDGLQTDLPQAIWWEEITGARHLVRATCDTILAGHSILLLTGDAFPWRQTFRDNVASAISRAGIDASFVDCAESYDGGDCAEFVVRQVAPSALSAYLQAPVSGKNGTKGLIAWLRRKSLLAGKCVWLKGVPDALARSLLQIVSGGSAGVPGSGSVVLELEALPPGARCPERALAYGDCVTPTDLRLFCTLLAHRRAVRAELRDYAAAVVAGICGTDPELAEQFFGNTDFAVDDPLDVLGRCAADQKLFERRGRRPADDIHAHPFALLRAGNADQLVRRVWAAQLQIALPRIEMERLQMVERYEGQLREALNSAYWNPQHQCERRLSQYGEEIEDVYDVELGTLCFMLSVRRADDHQAPFLAFAPEDKARAFFLRDMRNNKLAHTCKRQNCTPEEMRRILNVGNGLN